MNGPSVKFNCHECGGPVFASIDLIRLDLDPADRDVVVVTETCRAGHTREQRFCITEHGHLIQSLVEAGVQIPDGSDVEAQLTAITDAAAWLDSPAFDADRALLRLTGEVA